MQTVKRLAFRDITEHLKNRNVQVTDNFSDVWVVTGARMDTVEQRKLNRDLGIHKINYTKDNMSRVRKCNKMELSEKLKSARIKAGLTQKQLAELCGFAQGYIARIENGGIKKLQETNYKKISKIVEI